MYEKGDVVWVRNPRGKCTTKYGTDHVTEVISPQFVKIDGVPRHVKDLRPVIQTQLSSSDESDSEDSERLIYLNSDPLNSDSDVSSFPTDEASVEPRPADESTRGWNLRDSPSKKYPTKMKSTPLPCLWSWDQGGVWGKIMTLTYRTCVWLKKEKQKSQNGDAQLLLYLFSLA